MKTFSITEAFGRAWQLFKSHRQVAVFSTLIALAVSGLQDSRVEGPTGFFLWLLIMGVSLLIQIGWWKIMLKIEEGQSTKLKELIEHTEIFWKYVGMSILLAAMTIIGFIAFIIPGIYLLLRYQFAPVILIDKNKSIVDSFRESARITRGWKLKAKLLLMMIAMGIVSFIGLLLFGVGLLVAVPLAMLAFVHVYRVLAKEV